MSIIDAGAERHTPQHDPLESRHGLCVTGRDSECVSPTCQCICHLLDRYEQGEVSHDRWVL